MTGNLVIYDYFTTEDYSDSVCICIIELNEVEEITVLL
jgi:hypothetical protein